MKTPVLFADETTGGVARNWRWNFGDPASGTLNNAFSESPSHTFDSAGTYDITLIVGTEGGCSDTLVKRIIIVDAIKPEASFSASTYNPYVDQKIALADQSLNAPTSWKWTVSPNTVTWHDGTGDTSQNSVVSFSGLATYKVTLRASNKAGFDTLSRFFVTRSYSKPIAAFSASPQKVKAGQLVSFLDESLNDPTEWKWKFGDGDSSAQQHPIYQYKNTGTYSVRLTVKNPAGTDDTTRLNYITVNDHYRLCETDATTSPLFAGRITDSGDSTANYGDNSNCGFLIRPPCSGPITLTFKNFSYEAGFDFVRVYDGTNNTGKPLHTGNGFTGTTPPSVLTAYSGAMYIEEDTDPFSTSSGFVAKWSAVPNIKPKAQFSSDAIAYVNG
ncbi:MAG: PKD domain-containing protein, partial [Bacteroidota bacterium]|nr:PKD domain-containing protein [Bacteroidota bacterium]